MYQRKGLYLHLTGKLKEVVKVPVLVAGRMEDPDLASSALEEGMADAIVIGRGLLADPQLPNKIKAEKLDDIRPCLCCHDGCMGRIAQIKPISCAVNPQAGREAVYGLTPAEKPKRSWSSRRVTGMEGKSSPGHEVFSMKRATAGGVVLAGGCGFKADLRLVVVAKTAKA